MNSTQDKKTKAKIIIGFIISYIIFILVIVCRLVRIKLF